MQFEKLADDNPHYSGVGYGSNVKSGFGKVIAGVGGIVGNNKNNYQIVNNNDASPGPQSALTLDNNVGSGFKDVFAMQ